MKRSTAKKTPASDARRCAIYTRKSTAAGLEMEFNSLDAQREACLAYIQRQPGWTLVEDQYDDGGFTGANTDRPAFQRLMADVEAGKVDVIVVYKVDRLSRSLLDFLKMMERLSAAGASFVSVTQNFSTADAMGRLTMNLLASFAEFERSMIAERTRDKIAASRRKGKWTGGSVPFGYDVKDKKLVVNELEAIVVREAFELLCQHRQMALVARTLNERGHLRRVARVRSPGWTKDSIARLLKNPLYAGFITLGDELHAGEHPAIIEGPVWERSRRILDDVARELHHHGINPAYILRGLVVCAGCGGRMCPGSTRRGSREFRYYRCSNRDKHGTCDSVAVPAAVIEEFVVERLAVATTDRALVEGARAALAARIRKQRATFEQQRASLPGRIAAASANASKYAEELARVSGGRARQVLEAKLEAEGEALAAAEQQLVAVHRDLAAVADAEVEGVWIADAMADFSELWEVLTPPNRGRLLRAVVDRVVVDERSGRGEIHLIAFDATGSREVAA